MKKLAHITTGTGIMQATGMTACHGFLRLLFFTLLLFIVLAGGFAAQAASIQDYEFSATSNGTTLRLKLNQSASYKSFTLSNPPRLVIDVDHATWQASGNLTLPKEIKTMRQAERSNGSLRLVLEAESKIQITNSRITKENNQPVIQVSFITDSPGSAKKPAKPASLIRGYQSESPFALPKIRHFEIQDYHTTIAPQPTHSASGTPIPVDKPGRIITRKPIIVIDAGHGGKDPGAVGAAGTYEKHITLAYAKELQRQLLRTGQYKVYLTRTADHYVELQNRVGKARNWKADLFISLHADSHANRNTRGLSVYTLEEGRARRESKKLLSKADQKEVIRGVDIRNQSEDVQDFVINIAQRGTRSVSVDFAQMVVKNVGPRAKLLRRTHRSGSFAVLTGADTPSVLIELGYLSNRQEEDLLRKDRYRTSIADALSKAVADYFQKNPLEN